MSLSLAFMLIGGALLMQSIVGFSLINRLEYRDDEIERLKRTIEELRSELADYVSEDDEDDYYL